MQTITNSPPAGGLGGKRHFGLDWLRIGAFAVLILYHIGLYFSPWSWHVDVLRPVGWVVVPLLATAPWRMSLLFVISGFASATMAGRGNVGGFVRSRSLRLLLPLAFAMLVLNPPQGWVEARISGDTVGYLHWWLVDELHLAAGGRDAPTLSHMWFVAYVWLYAMLLGAWRLLPSTLRERIAASAARALQGWRLLVLPLGWLVLARAVIWPGVLPSNAPLSDIVGHALYLPAFAFGALLARAPSLHATIHRLRWVGATAALTGYAAILWNEYFTAAADIGEAAAAVVKNLGYALMTWGSIVALLALAMTRLDRDHRWRTPLTQAVFPFYIIHQTIVVLVGYWIRPLDLPVEIAFPVLLTATLAGCMAFWQVGQRVRLLRPLIGLPLLPDPVRPIDRRAMKSA